ncbi:AAA family ATPase [Sorangium sp. So ce118]
MPNPFKKQGDAFHQPGDWIAPHVGLVSKLRKELDAGWKGNAVVLGNVGSGKSSLLSSLARWFAEKHWNAVDLSLQHFTPEDALDLYQPIFQRLITLLGKESTDGAAKALGFHALGPGGKLRRDELVRLMREMASMSAQKGKPVYVLVDEGQLPAEAFESRNDLSSITEWFERLKGLGDELRAAGGGLVVTLPPSPWETFAPPKVRARFTRIVATPPTAEEIQIFVEYGLQQPGSGGPSEADKGLGRAILNRYEETTEMTLRVLHEILHPAWERARTQGARVLNPGHLDGA